MKAATKSSLGLLGAMAVAVALGLYAYLGVMKPEERKTEQKSLDEKLLALSPDAGAPSFTQLWITSGSETSALEKRGDAWFLTAPVEAKADPNTLRELLHQLETGKVTEALEPNPTAEDLVRYGLQPPRFSVRAAVEGSAHQHLIEGGIENPFDGSVFLRKGGQPTVYSAPGVLRSAFARSPFDLRDKLVLQVPLQELASVEVKTGRTRYALAQDQGQWRLTAPQQAKADAKDVSGMLSAFGSERATTFPADSTELRRRFDAPTLDATFQLTAGGRIRIRLAGGDGGLYALREEDGRPAVLAQVNPSAATHLAKTFDDLRDLQVLAFDREAVGRVALSPGMELVKQAAAETWHLGEAPAQAWKVSSLLWSLSTLEADRLVAENAKALRPYGLEPPARRIELSAADGAPLATLSIGGEVKGNGQRVYVLNGAGAVFEVEKTRLKEVPASAAELLEASADAGVAAHSPQ